METWTSRKFILTILVFILSFFLTLAGLITSSEWMEFVKFILGAYMTANVIDHAIKKPESIVSDSSSTMPIESVTVKGE